MKDLEQIRMVIAKKNRLHGSDFVKTFMWGFCDEIKETPQRPFDLVFLDGDNMRLVTFNKYGMIASISTFK